MIKKIVHIADIHIRTFRQHDEYKEVFERFFNDVKNNISDYEYDEVRIAVVGDLFHQKITISNEQILLGAWFIKELLKLAPTVIVPGNHDLLEDNSDRLDSITPLVTLIDNPNLKYFTESNCFDDENIVWCNYSILDGNMAPNIDESKIRNPEKTHIGLFHAPLIGSTTDIGYSFEDGEHASIFEGCDFVLLGDIHKRQDINFGGIQAVYPGSLIQQNYGESIRKHGFLIWDVETMTYNEFDVFNENIMITLRINSLDDLENDKITILNDN